MSINNAAVAAAYMLRANWIESMVEDTPFTHDHGSRESRPAPIS